MRNLAQRLSLLFLLLFIISCSKKREAFDVNIDVNNLTACKENTNCQYLFSEMADVSDKGQFLISGNYRLFFYSEEASGMSSRLYIKAPMEKDQFMLSSDEIRDGKVMLIKSCATCFMLPSIPVGGSVKGINVKKECRADQALWLLEAKIILQIGSNSTLLDTLSVKQYFRPNFVID